MEYVTGWRDGVHRQDAADEQKALNDRALLLSRQERKVQRDEANRPGAGRGSLLP